MWTQSAEVTRKETSVFTIRTIQKWEWGGGGWEYLGKEQMSLHRKSFKYRLNDHPQRTTWKEIPFWIRARTR